MTFRQFVLALRARWFLACCIFGAVSAASLVLGFLSVNLYTASATVVAESKADPVEGYLLPTSTGYIATQVDIISSPRVAQRVVKLLRMDEVAVNQRDWQDATGGRGDLTTWLAIKLDKALSVTPSRDSSVIDIAVTWSDPKTAATLANAFAEAYIDTNIELKVDPARQYTTWFDERSRALRVDLQAKQKRLADLQAQTGIVATDGRLDIENARLSELSTELVAIQSQRQDAQSRQKQIVDDPDSAQEVLQSQVIAGLKSDLSRAEAKLQDVTTNLGKNHPDYRTTAAEIAGLKSRIADETAKIAASIGGTAQVMARRESDLRAAIDAQRKRMLDMTGQHDQVAVLQNDVVTAQRNLDAVTQRLAQSSLESQTEQTNIVLLTKAVEPLIRSSPRYSINLLVGILLGLILSVATVIFLEMRNRRVREESDLIQLLRVPVFGVVPYIKPEGSRIFRATPGAVGRRVEPSVI
jgi:chain length determinant protein EpsF